MSSVVGVLNELASGLSSSKNSLRNLIDTNDVMNRHTGTSDKDAHRQGVALHSLLMAVKFWDKCEVTYEDDGRY